MTALPTPVQIGPYPYAVSFDTKQLRKANLYGQIQFSQQAITVRDDIGPDRLRIALLHEVQHGILENAGLRLTKRLEEFICVTAVGLYDTLRRNPDLVAYLLSEERAE